MLNLPLLPRPARPPCLSFMSRVYQKVRHGWIRGQLLKVRSMRWIPTKEMMLTHRKTPDLGAFTLSRWGMYFLLIKGRTEVQISCDQKKEHLLQCVVKPSFRVAFVAMPLYCYFISWQKSELLPMRTVETYIKTVYFWVIENVQFYERVRVNRGTTTLGDVQRGSCFSVI